MPAALRRGTVTPVGCAHPPAIMLTLAKRATASDRMRGRSQAPRQPERALHADRRGRPSLLYSRATCGPASLAGKEREREPEPLLPTARKREGRDAAGTR